jgi:hypothetical protein
VLLKEICAPGVTAVAERLKVADELPSLPRTVSVPVIVPEDVGVTATVKLLDCPVAMDIGNVAPGKLNCGLESVAWVIDTAVLPVLDIEIDCVACFPTPTLPKLTLVGFN